MAYQKETFDHADWFFRFHHHVMAQGYAHLRFVELLRPLCTDTQYDSSNICKPPILISYSAVAGSSYFILSGFSLQIDCENNRWCRTQVTAPVSTTLLTCFIIYSSCCTSLQEVLLGFCSLWHHESPKLDQMKVGSIETAAYYSK